MPRILRPKNLQRRLALRQRGHEIGLGRLQVGVEVAGAQRSALAHAGIYDNAVEGTQVIFEGPEYLKDLFVVIYVEGAHEDLDVGMGGFQLRF